MNKWKEYNSKLLIQWNKLWFLYSLGRETPSLSMAECSFKLSKSPGICTVLVFWQFRGIGGFTSWRYILYWNPKLEYGHWWIHIKLSMILHHWFVNQPFTKHLLFWGIYTLVMGCLFYMQLWQNIRTILGPISTSLQLLELQ